MGPNTNPVKKRHSYNTRDLYNEYRRGLKKNKEYNTVTYTEYKDIFLSFFYYIFNRSKETFRPITLPAKIGTFLIRESVAQRRSGWFKHATNLSKETKLKIISGFYSATKLKFYWKKDTANFKNKSVYVFKLTEKQKKQLKRHIKKN